MKKLLLSSVMTLSVFGFGNIAMAGSAGQQETIKGDIEAGKGKAAMCAGCHGSDGNSPSGDFPKLAGQNERYLIKQIADIKSNAREVPMMTGMVAGLSDQDMADIAAFYASQKGSIGTAKKELVELGEKIYRAGNKKTDIPACSACHSPTGKGNLAAGFPALQGQHAKYTEKQLKDFRTGTRKNDGEAKVMRAIAYRMKDTEIAAVASYIEGLHD